MISYDYCTEAIHDCDVAARVDYVLLEDAFGLDPRVRFCLRNDEVAAITGRKERLFELVPEPQSTGSELPNDQEPDNLRQVSDGSRRASSFNSQGKAATSGGSLTQQDFDGERDRDQLPGWGRVSMVGDGDGTTRFHAATSIAVAVAMAVLGYCPKRRGNPPLLAPVGLALAAAAHKAACLEPAFDVLKLRFKLGKSLFRNLGQRADRTALSVADLEGAGSGRGAYQSVFSNYVPASTVPRVTSWLTDVLGFSLTDTKTTATLHVINQELNVHYSIALTMEGGDDSTASLRKLKVGGSKNPSVTLMSGPQQLDLRLKLITQFREHPGLMYDVDAHSTARRVAAAVRTEGFDGFIRSKRGLPRNRHLEYGRRKTKFVYEGFMPPSEGEGGCGQRLRVSVTQVQDDKGTHYEISGCLPDVDAKLRRLLAQHRPPPPSPPPPAASVDDSGCFVPEWRRRGSSGGSSVGPGLSPVPVPVGLSFSRSSSGSNSGGGGRLYDSVSSSPTWTHATLPDPDSQWAVGALSVLSSFVTELNSCVGTPVRGLGAVTADLKHPAIHKLTYSN
ncbi:hypothetical protein VOLCADRAFT_93329 [Volvox carteri f. nagariensis]|uniref:Uncharacterized protein n=1 Tax=Volvox carteri f. nagariensis TaxID=3068 RepID=D8U1U9_VOLCA|nr:uncharacterized protein VOLCADRAFT_93329 [Volvox carteri f. nagariensis]EFJ46244.1 hypothetical protein VOLCADRAFT_93329 [Volvox carteri f. nagariensis]|eukprot:XP_002952691.1 hypothetical protein VOLCADRAFT_93329 [Volvox carteri f. nagariensis]